MDIVDHLFSKTLRLTYTDDKGQVKCFTCNNSGHWKGGGITCGHYLSRSNMALRYSFVANKPQCEHCNFTLNGNRKIFRDRLIQKYGERIVDYIEAEGIRIAQTGSGKKKKIRKRLNKAIKQLKKEKNL